MKMLERYFWDPFFARLIVPLTYGRARHPEGWRLLPTGRKKVLSFGNEKKNEFSFCISLTYLYLWLASKVLTLEKTQNSFGFLLA